MKESVTKVRENLRAPAFEQLPASVPPHLDKAIKTSIFCKHLVKLHNFLNIN